MTESEAERARSGQLRTGASAVLDLVARRGLDTCFANPGTTEMAFVRALGERPDVRAVPTLFEGVASGAADGYGRIAGAPGLTLLHLGPGLANATANLHNARRARTPILNIVGEHTTTHRALDAPLTSDIQSLAGTVAGCVRTPRAPDELLPDVSAAIDSAMTPPSSVSTVVVAADLQDAPIDVSATPVATPPGSYAAVPGARVEAVGRRLSVGGSAATIFLGGAALSRENLRRAARVAAATGASLVRETFHARADAGRDVPYVLRLPYFPEDAAAVLADADPVVLVGATEPVAFFGYPGRSGRPTRPGSVAVLADVDEDVGQALDDLIEVLGAGDRVELASVEPAATPTGRLSAVDVGRIVAAHTPEDAIVSVEGSSASNAFYEAGAASPPHITLSLTGGAIGQGLPVALGAAVASPDRQVISLQSDGSAQYTVQSLWTMAREQTRVVVVIVANHTYEILRTELRRMGVDEPLGSSEALTSLGSPPIDWPALARGYGVEATRAHTGAELSAALSSAMRVDGPFLIEANVEGTRGGNR